ncbi:ABC transporter permease [Amorphus sp. 3PC139-8]|uniref:ABC transporter permease n=1 Tax=Amorphus sp. 3PC139-8 TaxID=2735676 RepID=UPI00345D96CD
MSVRTAIDRRRSWAARFDLAALIGGFAVAALVVVAVAAPWLVPYDPYASNAAQALQPPSLAHWAGTDQIGRDVFSRLLIAARLDLLIAAAAVFASFAIGTFAGALAGYFGGWFDRVTGRLVDVLLAFPLFVLAMALAAALGTGVASLIVATAVVNLPFYVRLARAEVNARRGLGWVEAARLCGRGPLGVVFGALVPNVLPVLMVQASTNLAWAILNAAGLSFVGLGVHPPTAEWGMMVAEGARYLASGHWWLVVCPGGALAAAALAFTLLGDGLGDRLDLRGRDG